MSECHSDLCVPCKPLRNRNAPKEGSSDYPCSHSVFPMNADVSLPVSLNSVASGRDYQRAQASGFSLNGTCRGQLGCQQGLEMAERGPGMETCLHSIVGRVRVSPHYTEERTTKTLSHWATPKLPCTNPSLSFSWASPAGHASFCFLFQGKCCLSCMLGLNSLPLM